MRANCIDTSLSQMFVRKGHSENLAQTLCICCFFIILNKEENKGVTHSCLAPSAPRCGSRSSPQRSLGKLERCGCTRKHCPAHPHPLESQNDRLPHASGVTKDRAAAQVPRLSGVFLGSFDHSAAHLHREGGTEASGGHSGLGRDGQDG